MLVKTFAAALQGIDAVNITLEVNTMKGTLDALMVGMPDVAVRESLQRVWSAFLSNGFHKPNDMVLINLAPADIKKEGAAFDLPIAIGILAASEQLHCPNLESYLIMGELSLDGILKPIKGALPITLQAKHSGFKNVILPEENVNEAAVVQGINVYSASTLLEVVRMLEGTIQPEPVKIDINQIFADQQSNSINDFADVKGQENVKRALEVAAAGGHNILMIGPPGAGKSMMAKRLPTILPSLTLQEALETTKIHSVAGILGNNTTLITTRPFRSPHHTLSDIALTGGGLNPKPGEISLAHNGVLFMDELPEYKRNALEALRQPLEDRTITVSRAKQTITFPASFMLVAAMNPCPCGHYNDPTHACTCTPNMVQKYFNRISGPLLDRIDIQIEITPVPATQLQQTQPAEKSALIKERVINARKIQTERFKDYPNIFCNAQMTSQMMNQFCVLDENSKRILNYAIEKMHLSARAYDRILKTARTIADLEAVDNIQPQHIAEAISYRSLDRENYIQ